MTRRLLRSWGVAASVMLVFGALAPAASAHPELTGDTVHDDGHDHDLDGGFDQGTALSDLDAALNDVVSGGPSAKVTKNVAVAGRGERLVPDGTTDVWAHDGYAYLGTFNSPCGTGDGFGSGTLVQDRTGPGVAVFDVRNKNEPTYAGSIPSVAGSRINDVKVMEMNQGDVLVHSNESCEGGPGGFEVYNVDDPLNPVHLGHVTVDDINPVARGVFGATDVGVHNNYLFTRDGRDYNAVQAEGYLGSFQVFDITDPADPELVSWFGAEYVLDPSTDWSSVGDIGLVFNTIVGYLFDGFGMSQNRFLHDHYVTPDGTQAYLANWDEGLLLVDLGDLDGSAATLISQARDVENGSLDGEVNSHSVWPTADGTVVVEGEEDFNAIVSDKPLDNFTFGEGAGRDIYGVGISPIAGDAFEANPTGNVVTVAEDSVTVDSGPLAGNVYPATEGAGDQPKLNGATVSGEGVWIGRACNSDTLLNTADFDAGDIAIVRRGACTFAEKMANAQSLGAAAIVISNNVRQDTPWSGIRIWDYSDPANPILASHFNTECSADPFHESCQAGGTYSSHNVIVEGDRVYISWYSEGVLVLDISDPYNPVEVGRYHERGSDFEARNGGIQDVWGVYKVPEEPWIYASDRNGGLYVLKEFGSGSAKQGKS